MEWRWRCGRRRTRGDSERAPAPEVRQVNGPAGEERAGHADDAEDDLLEGGVRVRVQGGGLTLRYAM